MEVFMSSIQGFGSMQGMMGMMGMMGNNSVKSTLTDEQKQTVADILSNYDANNITADNAKEIFQKFSDAGITPQAGLKEAIEAAGFDAEQLRQLGMPDQVNGQMQMPPPPPPSSTSGSATGINASTLEKLQSVLDQYDLSNLSSDDQTNLISQLTSMGLLQSGSLINISA
jgi:hypothetical protein